MCIRDSFYIAILNGLRHKDCQCASPCQISSKSVKWLHVADILRFFGFPKSRPPPSWIFKNSNSYLRIRLRDQICVTVLNFIQNGSIHCWDVAIFLFPRRRPSAILDFQKFKFLMAGTFGRANLRHCLNFCQDRSIRCSDMAISLFFKMAAVRHVGFLKLRF